MGGGSCFVSLAQGGPRSRFPIHTLVMTICLFYTAVANQLTFTLNGKLFLKLLYS